MGWGQHDRPCGVATKDGKPWPRNPCGEIKLGGAAPSPPPPIRDKDKVTVLTDARVDKSDRGKYVAALLMQEHNGWRGQWCLTPDRDQALRAPRDRVIFAKNAIELHAELMRRHPAPIGLTKVQIDESYGQAATVVRVLDQFMLQVDTPIEEAYKLAKQYGKLLVPSGYEYRISRDKLMVVAKGYRADYVNSAVGKEAQFILHHDGCQAVLEYDPKAARGCAKRIRAVARTSAPNSKPNFKKQVPLYHLCSLWGCAQTLAVGALLAGYMRIYRTLLRRHNDLESKRARYCRSIMGAIKLVKALKVDYAQDAISWRNTVVIVAKYKPPPSKPLIDNPTWQAVAEDDNKVMAEFTQFIRREAAWLRKHPLKVS